MLGDALSSSDVLTAPGLIELNDDGVSSGANLFIALGGRGGPGFTHSKFDGTTDAAVLAILRGAWS